MRPSGKLALPLLAAAMAGCATLAPATPPLQQATLQQTVDSIIAAAPRHRMQWGILVTDAQSGRTLYAHNPEVKMIPASNTKLVVGLVALGRFGPDHRYRTDLHAGSRAGDSTAIMLIKGSGDPTWSTRFHATPDAPLDTMAAAVWAAGIRRVGELVVDASRFSDELVHPAWEVSDLNTQYAPPVDAIAIAEGVVRIVVAAGPTPGSPAVTSIIGDWAQPVHADVRTDTAGARTSLRFDYTARRDTIFVAGTIAAGSADTSTIAVTRPAHTAAHALADAMRRRGITVHGVRVTRDPQDAAAVAANAGVVTSWTSPTMSEIVAAILQPSQNWIAEQVLKTLGAEFGTTGTWRGGIAVELDYLTRQAGVDSTSVNLRDASGMSPQNLLSPLATVQMLAHAREQAWGSAYRAGMAQPGLRGSTLSNRLRQLDGRLFAKTGTISNVNSLSGYLAGDDGRDYHFSILTNGSGLPSGAVRSAIDDVLLAIVRHIDAP